MLRLQTCNNVHYLSILAINTRTEKKEDQWLGGALYTGGTDQPVVVRKFVKTINSQNHATYTVLPTMILS